MAALQFLYRHRVGWFSRPLSWARGHPDGNPNFVPPFGEFRLAGRLRPIFVSRRADAAVGYQHPFGQLRSVLARNKLAPTWLSYTLPEGRANRAVSGIAALLPDSPRWAWRLATHSPASSERFLAGLAPVCFAPNFLSEFSHSMTCDRHRPLKWTVPFLRPVFRGSKRFSDHRSDVPAESHRESVAFQRGQTNQPRLPFHPVLLGFILRASCRLPGTSLCSFKEP